MEQEKKRIKMTLEEYLGKYGVSSPISDWTLDKTRFPHGLTKRQKEQLQKKGEAAAREYSEKRRKYIDQYYRLVEEGELIIPSSLERYLDTAKGWPEISSVQAARRMCEKKGVDWRDEEYQEKQTQMNELFLSSIDAENIAEKLNWNPEEVHYWIERYAAAVKMEMVKLNSYEKAEVDSKENLDEIAEQILQEHLNIPNASKGKEIG